jgi:hypothetical protein
MGVPTSEVGYTSATTGRGDHEVHKGHVVALKKILERFTKYTGISDFKIIRPVNPKGFMWTHSERHADMTIFSTL